MPKRSCGYTHTFLHCLLGQWLDVVVVDPFNEVVPFEGLNGEGIILGTISNGFE